MRIRSYPDFQATRSAALGVMADVGALALPVQGIFASAGLLSCFVSVPLDGGLKDAGPAPRTQLRIGPYAEILLSLEDLLSGTPPLGLLLANRPLSIAGQEYQLDDADECIAVVPDLMVANGSYTIGPHRCCRCNQAIPDARTRLIGSRSLCIKCQLSAEGSKQ
jgi:Prokaryotic dksA/traR C4-type zinc finger